ncbi:MAG: universal stress protein, partial [Mycobacterium sp.]|nr:universal stress protein [Mycobacterium sp.]
MSSAEAGRTAGEKKTVIVIAFDGSPTARRAVHYASRFLTADRAVVLTVWSPLDR